MRLTTSLTLLATTGILIAIGSTSSAQAALRLDSSTSNESLVVAADGSAEVSYTTRGTARTVTIAGSSVRYSSGPLTPSPAAKRVPPTVPFALVQYQLPDGTEYALQKFNRTGQFGVLGPLELYLARWHDPATVLTLVQAGNRICGTVTYHGHPVFGSAHTAAGNPLDAFGRNVYLDALRPAGWYRLLGVLARPRGFALALTADRVGSQYRALVVGPNVMGDLAPVASATTDPSAPAAACPFAPGTYAHA